MVRFRSGYHLQVEPDQGEEGILSVRESLCNVDAETAGAWCPEESFFQGQKTLINVTPSSSTKGRAHFRHSPGETRGGAQDSGNEHRMSST